MRIAANRTPSVLVTEVKEETRFSHSSLVVVVLALLLLLTAIGFKMYRFTLPTEGWSLSIDFREGLSFDQNLLGLASPFEKGDVLLEVSGVNMQLGFDIDTSKAQAGYKAGNTVLYKVQHGDEALSFEVPLYHWTASGIVNSLWQIVVGKVFQFNSFVLLGLAIAGFVFYKRPGNSAAQLLLLIFVTNTASGISNLVGMVTPADALDPVARVVSVLFGADIHPLLIVPLFLHLALVFPKPKWSINTLAVPVMIYGLPLLMHAIRDFFVPGFPADVFVPVYFLMVLVSLIHSFITTKDKTEKTQIKWVVYGFSLVAIASILWVLSAVLQWLPPVVASILNWFPSELMLCLCLAVAILRYRLFDIDVIINRSLVYGTLSLGVIGVYLGLVMGSSYLLQTQSNVAISLIAIAIILLLLKPSYQRLQESVNRFIPVTTIPLMSSTVLTDTVLTDNVTTPSKPAVNFEETKRNASVGWVLILAALLLLFSVTQKAYRLSLATDGWSTTTDFESDEPILGQNLLGVASDLQTGDRVIAVNGLAFNDLAWQAVAGKTNLLESYQSGQTVRYTVLRDGQELDLEVLLYAGSSFSTGTILKHFFIGNPINDIMLWIGLMLASLVFWKRPHNLTAQLLFLQAIAWLASSISWTVTPLGVADTLHPVTFYTAAFFTHWIHLLLGQPLGLHVILSFPKPSRVLQQRWSVAVLYGLPLGVLFISLYMIPELSPFMVVALYNLLGIIAAVRLFFKHRDPIETAQVRWFAFGFAFSKLSLVSFGLSVAGLLPREVNTSIEAIPGQLLFLLCMSIAILRYRLFDINVILNRTLVYGGLSAGIIGLYALVVGGVGRLVQVQNNVLLSLLATGLIAVAFHPLRVRLQHAANHLLYGERDDPYKVLSKLSEGIERTLEPAKLLPAITETIAQTLKLPYAAIALGQHEHMQIVASHGTAKGQRVILPLAYQGETVGELRLEPRAGETFKASELNLLKTIAQQASVAAHTVKQHLDLQLSREALVTAREEERLRIRRDLHDGLGPELASLTLKLDATRNLLRQQPDKAEQYLLELKKQSQEALASIRRLVYALRPPALDELGLRGAIQEAISKYEPILVTTLVMPEKPLTLTAAVEVACYRIVQEALSNVARHANATKCFIRLELAHDLRLTVEDNGQGLPEHYQAGVGLRSMRERAEELGGSFQVFSQQGTKLLVTLPLHSPGYRSETSSLKVN